MTDPRAGKTYYLNWDEWEELCFENGLNPLGQTELSFDLGGGNYYTVALSGKKGERMKKLIIPLLIILLLTSLVGCIHRLDDRGLVRIVMIEQEKNEARLDFEIRFAHTAIRLQKDGYGILFFERYIEQNGYWWGIIICRRK